ncbi:orotate phosphoribosyltransferase [Helicobacter pylori]|uniref:orotate phosphoribosyltransferase n=1 Tax=Helicobacter pylori TaxID=210 RepID=UPI00346623D5
MIEVIDYTYLYLKNLYFKSLRWFCGSIPLIHDLINIFTLKPSIFDKKIKSFRKITDFMV